MSRCEACGDAVHPWTLGDSRLGRCVGCGHLVRDVAEARAYHRDHAYGGDPTLDAARLALTYRALVADGRPESVFEIGFGSGALLRRFLDAGSRVAGTDPDQLELALDPEVARRGSLFTRAIEDIDPAALASDRVDMVYGIHVLEHVADPAETLRRSREVLNPGGTAHFFTPAGDWAGLAVMKDAWWMLEDPTHVRFFTADSLERMARDAGFANVEIRRPVMDSLVHDAASVVRRVRPRDRPNGVLAQRSTTALAGLGLPATLAMRALVPRTRPTLHLVARAAG